MLLVAKKDQAIKTLKRGGLHTYLVFTAFEFDDAIFTQWWKMSKAPYQI